MSSEAMQPVEAGSNSRVMSVDFLRGLTMFVMLFANLGFKGAPAFMQHHWPGDVFYGATYVDYIFPMFLFLIGVSIPLAFRKYDYSWKSQGKLLWHVVFRSCLMLGIGVLLINGCDQNQYLPLTWLDPLWTAIGADPGWAAQSVWRFIMLLGVILLLHRLDPKKWPKKSTSWILRGVGAVLLLYYIIFFKDHNGGYFQSYWWEIIGLLGWAYLSCGIIYLILRRDPDLLPFALLTMVIFSIAARAGHFEPIPFLRTACGKIGGLSINTMFGVALGSLWLSRLGDPVRTKRLLWSYFIMAVIMAGSLTPFFGLGRDLTVAEEMAKQHGDFFFIYGVSKNIGTLGWMLLTAMFAGAGLLIAWQICDRWKWNFFPINYIKELGSVSLMAYLFHFEMFNILAFTSLAHWRGAECMPIWGACSISVALTILIAASAIVAKRLGFTLKL